MIREPTPYLHRQRWRTNYRDKRCRCTSFAAGYSGRTGGLHGIARNNAAQIGARGGGFHHFSARAIGGYVTEMQTANPFVVPNSLYWVMSLAPEDQGISRRIREDIEPLLTALGIRLFIHEPESAEDFMRALGDIEASALSGAVPLVHLDAHGDEESGFGIAATGEFIPWLTLAEQLRRINIATHNNLIVVSAVCFSMATAEKMDVSKASPFYLLIAPEEKVEAGFLADNIVPFYRAIWDGVDLAKAFEQRLASKFMTFHCEVLLKSLLTVYVRNNCTGAGARQRREDFYTLAVKNGQTVNREARRATRSMAKQFSRPNREMFKRFERFAARFMIGRPISFTMQSIVDTALKG